MGTPGQMNDTINVTTGLPPLRIRSNVTHRHIAFRSGRTDHRTHLVTACDQFLDHRPADKAVGSGDRYRGFHVLSLARASWTKSSFSSSASSSVSFSRLVVCES